MRKFKILLTATLVTVALIACNEQAEVTTSEPEFVEVSIPSDYKASTSTRTSSDIEEVIVDIKVIDNEGNESIGQAKLVMPEDDETLISFEMTSNIFEETSLTPDFWVSESTANGRVSAVTGCFRNCKADHRDGNGLGKCRASCWIDIAVVVAVVVIVVTF